MLNFYYLDMNTLFDNIFSGYSPEFLHYIYLLAVVFGILTITSKNPIVSLICLILLFGIIASDLIMLNLEFLGYSYLIVYVGAVSILFIFVLMLLDMRKSELENFNLNSISLALLIAIFFIKSFSFIMPGGFLQYNLDNIIYLNYFSFEKYESIKGLFNILFSTSFNWDINITSISSMASIGNLMYTSHSIWLLITGYILLLAMIGTIAITFKEKIN